MEPSEPLRAAVGAEEDIRLSEHLNQSETPDDQQEDLSDFAGEHFITVSEESSGLRFFRHGPRDGSGLEMARFHDGTLHLYPKQGSDYGADSAYEQLKEIQLLEFDGPPELEFSPRSGPYLLGLPEGLGTSFYYGLNFPMRFRCIAWAVEDLTTCQILRLTRQEGDVGVDGDVLSLSYASFGDTTHEIDLYRDRSTRILDRLRRVSAYNLTATATGVAPKEPSKARLPAIQKLAESISGNTQLDDREVEELADVLSKQSKDTAVRNPRVTNQLRDNLNLVSLEVLIAEFRKDLSDSEKSKDESHWQHFFERNTFALQQLFGAPVVEVSKKQLSVKSAKSDGRGARITDFLLANAVTQEGLVVEIKTPAASLMDPKPYRGDGSSAVFRPHPDLTGAVAQLQSQKESLREKLTTKLDYDDPLLALRHAAPRGAVIVGTIGDLDGSVLDSFRRYRDGLHDVSLLAFDEVAARLEVLLRLLKAAADGN